MAYEFTNSKGQKYMLHKRDVILRGSKKQQTIYFFARKEGKGSMNELPEGFKVMEVTKTGLPVLKKK